MFSVAEVEEEIQPFVLINLINLGLGFTSVLFILGRYIWKKHKFFSEFNIVLAKDLS